MNTMMNTATTAEFSHRAAAPVEGNAFFAKLGRKAFGLLCMIAALNSVEKALLAEHIVLE